MSSLDRIVDTQDVDGMLAGNTSSNDIYADKESGTAIDGGNLPAKFRGKSVDEIIDSYVNLEREHGRQGNELGELRRLSDTLIQRSLKQDGTVSAETSTAPRKKAITTDDFLEDPVEAVRAIVSESLAPVSDSLRKTSVEKELQELSKNHPDFKELVTSSAFQEWVLKSKARTNMWTTASSGNIEYADELFSQYKAARNSSKSSDEDTKTSRTKAQELDSATAINSSGSRDGAGNSGGKPKYRRAALIRMQLEDPEKYVMLQDDIMAAYAEGRVV